MSGAPRILQHAAAFLGTCSDCLTKCGQAKSSEIDAAIDTLDAAYRELRAIAKARADAASKAELDAIKIGGGA